MILRQLCSIGSMVSLLLCVASVVAFPLSFCGELQVIHNGWQSRDSFDVIHGHLGIAEEHGPGYLAVKDIARDLPPPGWEIAIHPMSPNGTRWEAALIPEVRELDTKLMATGVLARQDVTLPLWLLASAFAMPAVIPRIRRGIRRRGKGAAGNIATT